jgi:hypothetical protein
MDHAGRCHCGLLKLTFHTEMDPLPLRRCTCSYCRAQGAVWCSDPRGQVSLDVPANVIRYSFNTRTADFLICPTCGVLVAVVAELEGGTMAVLNACALEGLAIDHAAVAVVDHDRETLEQRQRRRARHWTPAALQVRAPAG